VTQDVFDHVRLWQRENTASWQANSRRSMSNCMYCGPKATTHRFMVVNHWACNRYAGEFFCSEPLSIDDGPPFAELKLRSNVNNIANSEPTDSFGDFSGKFRSFSHLFAFFVAILAFKSPNHSSYGHAVTPTKKQTSWSIKKDFFFCFAPLSYKLEGGRLWCHLGAFG